MQFSLQHRENLKNNQDKISERKYSMAQNKPKAARDVKITKQSKSTSGAKASAKNETNKQTQTRNKKDNPKQPRACKISFIHQ